MKLKTIYKSPPERQPGAKWLTNNFGEIEIIGKIDDGTGRNYFIKFLNTGAEIIANGSRFASGDIKDPMAKTVCGVGCFGIGPYSGKTHERELKLWHRILQRCYKVTYEEGSKEECYKDVIVCDEWLNFQNFCKDIEELRGYDIWKNDTSYAIDKDGLINGNKIYRKEACQFIYCGENTAISNKSVSVYIGIDPKGIEYYFRNQRIFAENNNLKRGGISAVVAGDQFTHRDWKFRRLTQEEINLINLELIQD